MTVTLWIVGSASRVGLDEARAANVVMGASKESEPRMRRGRGVEATPVATINFLQRMVWSRDCFSCEAGSHVEICKHQPSSTFSAVHTFVLKVIHLNRSKSSAYWRKYSCNVPPGICSSFFTPNPACMGKSVNSNVPRRLFVCNPGYIFSFAHTPPTGAFESRIRRSTEGSQAIYVFAATRPWMPAPTTTTSI